MRYLDKKMIPTASATAPTADPIAIPIIAPVERSCVPLLDEQGAGLTLIKADAVDELNEI